MKDPGRRFVVPVQGGSGRGRDAVPAVAAPAVPAPAPGDARFRALFEHAPAGVALSQPDGRFIDVNATLRDLLDGTGIDPGADGLADLARHLPEGSEEARTWLDGLAAVRSGRAPSVRAELPLAPAGAPPRWAQATSVLVVLGDRPYLLTHLEDTTGRHLAEQRLVRLALHDGLTGLANRTLLDERFQAALARDARTGLHTGVLYVDLDDFGRVNDTLGHEAGDRVLVEVGRRLAASLRAGDTAGRVGGDEFVVVAGDVPDAAALAELTRRVTAALAVPPEAAGAPVVAASVGAALARPGEGLAAVMRRADAAMFAVKRGRRAGRADAAALRSALLSDAAAGIEGSPAP